MNGLVLYGSKNLFTVKVEEKTIECRIKGKILKETTDYYNPLAPGDLVEIAIDPADSGYGSILKVEARRNFLSRYNQKGQLSQLLACNIDYVLCVTTPASPPFRPRFIDRALVQAENAEIPVIIICNKWDCNNGDPAINERLEDFERIGYPVLRVSALTGAGMNSLRHRLVGQCAAMLGQSGVGKSSLINALDPELRIQTASINNKYDRGNHTTVMGAFFELEDGIRIIDTPGIRRFIPDIPQENIIYCFPELAPLAGTCTFGLSCSHMSEAGCAVTKALHSGAIHPDRYETFLRLKNKD